MKALKIIILTFCITFSFSAFSKDDEAKTQKATMNYAVQTYIDAITQGKIKGLTEVLDNDVKFTLNQGEKIVSFNRNEMMNVLKGSENIQQNCKTDYSIVEQNDTQSIVKVTMTYDVFTRINYVTVAHTNKGWKITNVSSVFN